MVILMRILMDIVYVKTGPGRAGQGKAGRGREERAGKGGSRQG